MAEREYYRLTRSRQRREGFRVAFGVKRASLWMGKDHLLNLRESSYSEEYRRFYFRDIQSITICITMRRTGWNIALPLLMAASFALLRLVASNGTSAAIVLPVFGIPLLINNIRGTSCRVFIRTRVQTEELSSLDRLKKARHVLNRIRPLISAAQGHLTEEELSRRIKETRASAEEAPPFRPLTPQSEEAT